MMYIVVVERRRVPAAVVGGRLSLSDISIRVELNTNRSQLLLEAKTLTRGRGHLSGIWYFRKILILPAILLTSNFRNKYLYCLYVGLHIAFNIMLQWMEDFLFVEIFTKAFSRYEDHPTTYKSHYGKFFARRIIIIFIFFCL